MARSEKFLFTNDNGETLAGRLDLPDEEPRACALFAHCFTCSKESLAASRISRALTDYGIAVLRFDFTGLGGSEGDFANTNFSSNVADLVSAAARMGEEGMAPRLLIGHSLGGAAVIVAAGQIPEARAVVTIAAPSDVSHVTRLFTPQMPAIEEEGKACVTLGGREFTIRKQFIEDVRDLNLSRHLADLDRALVIFHSPQDEAVPVDHARKIYEAARHPKSFISLDGASHLLSRREDAEYVAGMIAAWCRRYIPWPEQETETAESPPAEGFVVVRSRDGKYAQDVLAAGHRLAADEPESLGGGNLGPAPYDYLLAALGTCTAMTMRMYAEHKDIPLEGVEVHLRHRKVHAEDCADCETREGRVERIERKLKILGDLSPDQIDGLVRIADRCPVHNTLLGEIKIDTALLEGRE